MLKEYRICMPISVDEYKLGQLYMIARHSAEQSDGGEGIEVIENGPHSDPVHGEGQFTEKRVHLSGKLPAWIRSYVPRFIYLTEKAWNYYPYTETEYTCSIIPRFSIKVKTRYENNNGSSENCLGLSEDELKQRIVEHVDILDPIEEKHYKEEEDPKYFTSVKTGRGPLKEGWREVADVIMCSYKLVDVSFQVFGLQTKVEDWSHRAIRNVLLLGHIQAFAWIDHWFGMSIEDIRAYETNMQEETNAKIRSALQEKGAPPQSPTEETNEKKETEEEEEEEKKENDNVEGANSESKEANSPSTPSSSQPSPKDSEPKPGYISSWFKWS